MTDFKQICIHHINGNCKYGDKCTKVHTTSSPELLVEIEKKGPSLCAYYPNCKFNNNECKKIHIIDKNIEDINELTNYYNKIMLISTKDINKLRQIDRIKKLIKLDLDSLKDTYEVLIIPE